MKMKKRCYIHRGKTLTPKNKNSDLNQIYNEIKEHKNDTMISNIYV